MNFPEVFKRIGSSIEIGIAVIVRELNCWSSEDCDGGIVDSSRKVQPVSVATNIVFKLLSLFYIVTHCCEERVIVC